MDEQITLEELVVLARRLSLDDKVRLIEYIAPEIEREARAGMSEMHPAWLMPEFAEPELAKPKTTHEGVAQPNRRHAPPIDGYMDIPYDPAESWRTFYYYEVN